VSYPPEKKEEKNRKVKSRQTDMSRDKVESAESERVNNLMMGEKKRKGNKK
jgi:hypothetical protein